MRESVHELLLALPRGAADDVPGVDDARNPKQTGEDDTQGEQFGVAAPLDGERGKQHRPPVQRIELPAWDQTRECSAGSHEASIRLAVAHGTCKDRSIIPKRSEG